MKHMSTNRDRTRGTFAKRRTLTRKRERIAKASMHGMTYSARSAHGKTR